MFNGLELWYDACMRKIAFVQGDYYHICNRSNDGHPIFLDGKDYARFLFLLLFYQAPTSFFNLGRYTSYYVKHSVFNIEPEIFEKVIATRRVVLNAFAIIPNHFHLLAQSKEEKGISRYLHRVQDGYAKYFNAKYKKQGHLFQGAFRAVAVKTDEQLLYLSAYIHRNPRGIPEWNGKERMYPWSSYQDCIKENRWEALLKPDIFLNQFSTPKEYEKFVETSTAKLKPGESPIEDLLLE